MKFVIPSLSRATLLCEKTLALLVKKFQIDQSSIYVFVVAEEYESYALTAHVLYPGIRLMVGPLGLHHMRNFIHAFFPENEELVFLDDDITDLVEMVEDTGVLDKNKCDRYPLRGLTTEQFKAYLTSAYSMMRKEGIYLWGIYPVKNGFFMKDLPAVTYDLRFIVGCFWGCINRPERKITIEEKEDVERTLLYFKEDKKILRFNRIAPVTTYYKQKGGMQARGMDRLETSKQSCQYLIEKYPEYCRLYTGKKSGVWEVRLLSRSNTKAT